MLCPICKKEIPEADEKPAFHPFCSERCKLIDLGRWLDGKYQIPVRDSDTDDDPEIRSPRSASDESE